MPTVSTQAIARYLESLLQTPVHILSVTDQGKQEHAVELKSFGYGVPLFIEFEAKSERRKIVLETMSASSFGHEHFADRAQAILWEHAAFNNLPKHVRSLDSGAFLESGEAVSLGTAQEFFLLTEFVAGTGYYKDLDRIRSTGIASGEDFKRVDALATYLAGIHARKQDLPALYVRRVRELLGHGECIMGLIDNYPPAYDFIDEALLKSIELSCIEWRWRLKPRTHRLSQVHGDFHPWNILFREGTDFTLLDRSRGEWGEPADDITCLSINFIFSSLLRSGKLEGAFEKAFRQFWDVYMELTNDREILETAAPFFAWRGLVIGSPVWYPRIPLSVRKTIFNFIKNILDTTRFEPADINRYLA
ncbi:MAG TPA: phosphotransferase [Nitrospirota bacterium]|nr:phosphotransferase [Nitrospirota bacterium]